MSKKENNEEIDLGIVLNSLKNSFNKLQGRLFDLLFLFVKFKFSIIILFVFGFFAGMFLDNKNAHIERTSIFVIPNYDSSELLYQNIETISSLLSKGKEEDLNKIFGESFSGIRSISIKPINDLRLLIKSGEIIDLLKESTKDKQLSWIQNEFEKGRIQKYHSIEIISDQEEIDMLAVTNSLMNYLNSNPYFKEVRLIALEDAEFQLNELARTLTQIDSIFSTKNWKNYNSGTTSQHLYLSNNSEFSNLLEYKSELLEGRFEMLRLTKQMDEVIQLVHVDRFLKPEKSIFSSSLKTWLPILLVSLFLGINIVISYINYIRKFSSIKNKKED